jgi:uncharacterized protein YjbI with pentapeptide repeats
VQIAMGTGLMVLLIVTFALLALISVLFVPGWQLRKHAAQLGLQERLELTNEYRRTVAQIVGGIAVLVGLYFTWQQLSATHETLQLNQRAAVNERFTKATEQLSNQQRSIRIGGIYAFQQIATDNPGMRAPIIQLLSSFLAESAQWKSDSQQSERPPADIQVTIHVISAVPRGKTMIVLRGLDLRGGQLAEVDFRNMDLGDAHFENSNLTGADFTGASLSGTHFDSADLSNSKLDSVKLIGAHFRNSRLHRATLTKSDLRGADFAKADFSGADLRSSEVSEACFGKSVFTDAEIAGIDFTSAFGVSTRELKGAVSKSQAVMGSKQYVCPIGSREN